MNRKQLGINGVHAKLGTEITEAEFRGYVIARMEEHNRQTQEIKDSIKATKEYIDKLVSDGNNTHTNHNTRIVSLETTRAQQGGFIAGVSAAGGLLMSIGLKLLWP